VVFNSVVAADILWRHVVRKDVLVLGADHCSLFEFRVKIVKFEPEYVSISFLKPDADDESSLGDTEVMRLSRRQAGELMKAIDLWLDE